MSPPGWRCRSGPSTRPPSSRSPGAMPRHEASAFKARTRPERCARPAQAGGRGRRAGRLRACA
jgi:hypothetical protein